MGAPVILCGKTEAIGKGVIANLKPEFDVIHFIMTPESGKKEIPMILEGKALPPSGSELGSKDYSQKPVAVILGGGYDDKGIEVMMEASKNIHPIPWLRPDLSRPTPPLGPEYGKAMVARIKERFAILEKDGQKDEENVVWY